MSCEVIVTHEFARDAKRLIKKYPSLRGELAELAKTLEVDPQTGTPLGNNCFKIRLAIKSKGRGKSSGARVISYIVTKDEQVYLLTIYDKFEYGTVSDSDLKTIIKRLDLPGN